MKKHPTTIQIAGPVAEDKDYAREVRKTRLLPALSRGEHVILDFSSVTTATQSFLHACISEAFRTHGDKLVDRITFFKCSSDIQQLIVTVIEYSLRARTLSQEVLSSKPQTIDVPQADNLQRVRAILDCLGSGRVTLEDIGQSTGFSLRHVQYRMHAARIIGLVRMGGGIASLTDIGKKVLETEAQSAAERELLTSAIRASPLLRKICPTLLDPRAPTNMELARRIHHKTGLSLTTSARRAQALLAWRRYLVDMQLNLPGVGRL